jgi:hypothetical protein
MKIILTKFQTVQGTEVSEGQLLQILDSLLRQANGQTIDDDEVILHVRRCLTKTEIEA